MLAKRLKAVLDRSLWIDLDDVADSVEGRQGDGLPADRDELGRIPGPNGPSEPVRLARLDVDGRLEWRFARSTVARIPAWC